MNVYMTEEEQIDLIRKFWRDYGNLVLSAILAAALAIASLHWWEQRTYHITEQASVLYEQMLSSVANDDATSVTAFAQELQKTYPKTPYAKMAAFALARLAVIENKFSLAQGKLEWVVEHAKSKPLRQVARIRLARVLNSEKKQAEALKVLQPVYDKAFVSAISEARGDIYLASGQSSKARDAYAMALEQLSEEAPARPVLQMKFHDLAAPGSQVANLKNTQVVQLTSKE